MRERFQAYAVQYPGGERAPTVTARGAGTLAAQIAKIAQEHGVPVRKDESLASLLNRIPLQAPVSPQMYTIVAELLAFLYEADKAWLEAHPDRSWLDAHRPPPPRNDQE